MTLHLSYCTHFLKSFLHVCSSISLNIFNLFGSKKLNSFLLPPAFCPLPFSIIMLVKIFISGLIGAASSVALNYGVASVPCGLVSPGADKVCFIRAFTNSLDSWKFGFILGAIFGLASGADYRRIASRIQPIHLCFLFGYLLFVRFSNFRI
jgi:hypothetical protein